MSYETILVEQRDRVALITLNRPEQMNAITARMRIDLCEAIDAVNQDPSLGAIVLTGAARKARPRRNGPASIGCSRCVSPSPSSAPSTAMPWEPA